VVSSAIRFCNETRQTTGHKKMFRSIQNWIHSFNRPPSGDSLESRIASPFSMTRKLSEVQDYFYGYHESADLFLSTDGPIPGLCFVCEKEVLFEVNRPSDGGDVNWRETVKCPHCQMINRWRACIHLFHEICKPTENTNIYLTEVLSPIHQYISGKFPNAVSSEFFADSIRGKKVKKHGQTIRNEDVTQLTFPASSFDSILCFDVLEHVPEYKMALLEFRRVLSKGGYLILTVPFNFQQKTTVRAVINDDGVIEHLLEPDYHGDPLSDQGVLSYYDFGMSLIDDLNHAGFEHVNVVCFRSNIWGYQSVNVAFVAKS
jgi:SAM-dependent methyltransferase